MFQDYFDSAMNVFSTKKKDQAFFSWKVVITQSDAYRRFYAPIYAKWLPLIESLLWAAARKNEAKLRKTEKHGKKSNSNESDLSKNEIPDLNSLKHFNFESKTNIGDINISSSY